VEIHEFFFNLMVMLLTARVLAELAVRMRSPAVIGELLAGVLLGPSLLGWIEPVEAIRLLAEIGIILLSSAWCCWRCSTSSPPAAA